uniref:Reverse transcriptase Ty1/copia-type domain-containing protein n=1 Tax=Chromera velia CCMP2878 TaxID=1169474 RepID=A0A0G4GUL6_9ALVE|eukprot:Cvel_23429.t1-p1 / transcript=Cvel_23429.t1 / gene=Cvel_23429 / organism=Chromera_velia_CCMP2878 / gene_product=hypothetical protein / transcript_product=hypothetical protein / location=Cvel_scaffold2413:15184-17136(+) / protein_length=357 / sequence_SO=supercontig / SO=protein_coding / is_pseudo=false
MGLSGGYSLHIQDQENDYLGVVVVEEKSSDAIDAVYERWTNSLEGDLTPQVMTDHGTEFQGKFGARLTEREAYNPLTPVGSHHSLGKNECSHREWLTILRGILHDRGLDNSHWRDFASLAATKYNRQPRGQSAHEIEHHDAQIATSPPFFLWDDKQQQASVGTCSAATTHTPLPRCGLSPEQLEGRAASREKELSSFSENDVYKRVPIAEVPPEQVRSAIPTHFVDTMKRQKAGEWDFKSRVVADGSPFFDHRERVTTSCATASQWAMCCALAMAFAYTDFDPHEIVVADVKTAYLMAVQSDCVYVRPPKDYPDYSKYLWYLNRALYGMKDSGNLWDRSRNKTLAVVGWVPSPVRRV